MLTWKPSGQKTAHAIVNVVSLEAGARGTTFFKTSRMGVGVNEGKMRALMKWYGSTAGVGGKGGWILRHRTGNKVGKEVP